MHVALWLAQASEQRIAGQHVLKTNMYDQHCVSSSSWVHERKQLLIHVCILKST